MTVGDKVIWKPFDFAANKPDTSHRWYGAKGRIIMRDLNFNLAIWWIALDDFPLCNNRKHANRFLALEQELEVIS